MWRNDKFKNFFENHFEITNNDSDRIAKDELRDMYNTYTKCNFSASSIMTDIQRLQLNYNRGLRCMYNGVSLRGVIIGIKKLKGQQSEPVKVVAKQSDLDFGLDMEPEPEITNDYDPEYTDRLEKDLRETQKQYTELQIEHDDLKEQFEALKEKFEAMQVKPPLVMAPVKSVLQMIDGSDSEDEDEDKTVRLKDNKILKALGCDTSDCDFLEE